MLRDLRFALRLIWAQRWFSAAIVVTLTLGIGANTTVFTLVNAVLFKPLPFPGGERLVTARNHRLSDPGRQQPVSYPDFRGYQDDAPGQGVALRLAARCRVRSLKRHC